VAQLKFGSAGVSAQEIDRSGPVTQEPAGIPAGVIGTATKGPAFVPVTLGKFDDFKSRFGATDGEKFGPLAANEWLKNATALTYLRVLGIGDGRRRNTTGNLAGSINSAGFVVGEKLPDPTNDGVISPNPYANSGGPEGRTYFIGCLMSESNGSTVFSSARLQGTGSVTPNPASALPIIRGVLLAPSGVILRLSSSLEGTNTAPTSGLVASDLTARGQSNGSVVLLQNTIAKQEFTMLLNGHKGTDPSYPNVLTASFDMTAPNYIGNVLNTDPSKLQQAGHYLYAHFDVYPSLAEVTGTVLLATLSGSGASANQKPGSEASAFLLTSSLGRNVGSSTVPNYENFQDRYSHPKTPWFVSQRFGGTRNNLFRLHSLDDGAGAASNYKISIENIAPSTDGSDPYGSFDVVIRRLSDRDTDPRVIEAFRGVNLDPESDRYIGKIIGDADVYFDFDKTETGQKLIVAGQFPLRSNLVRVEVSNEVDGSTVDATALPFGFRGHAHFVTSGSAPMAAAFSTQLTSAAFLKRVITPPVPFRKNISVGEGNKKTSNSQFYWGVQFEHQTSVTLPNGSTLANDTIKYFAKFYPDFMTATENFVAGENEGVADTAANGVMDADRFNLGLFSLDYIKVVTGSVGSADPQQWGNAEYVRDGNITTDATAKVRAVTTDDFTQANRRFLKFSTFMQGGFDGVNVFDEDESEINDAAVNADMDDAARGRTDGPNVRAYVKALNVIQNTTDVDIQLLALPGIRNPVVTNSAVDTVETRFDTMLIMDIEQVDTSGELVRTDAQMPDVSRTAARFADRSMDTSFAAAYFPDVIIEDPTTKTNVVCPPSVAVLGAFSLNDKVGHPWFAPAGFARGALPSTLESRVSLSKENMDDLYDVDVNPLVAFPGNSVGGTNPKGGVVVWGQKTLQQASSALDRVNVRRLLIDIRRQCREIGRTIVFEPNREATLARFSAAITPRLQRIQALSGVEKFKVIIDSSTTTQQDVLNNTIRGIIKVLPTKSIEFVSLDFEITNDIDI
jgi:phage tail sheath protein FI